MKKRIYKGMWLTMLFIIIGMTTITVVKADNTYLCHRPQDVRICLGTTPMEMTPPADWSYCSRYDFNQDNKINLIDVSFLANSCFAEPTKEKITKKDIAGMLEVKV